MSFLLNTILNFKDFLNKKKKRKEQRCTTLVHGNQNLVSPLCSTLLIFYLLLPALFLYFFINHGMSRV